MNPSFHLYLSVGGCSCTYKTPSEVLYRCPSRALKLEPAVVTKYRAHNFKWLSPGQHAERWRFPQRRRCVCAHSIRVMALIERKRRIEAVGSVERGSLSHLWTPSTCSLVKVLAESPPPVSSARLSVWSELSAALLRYAPLLAELPFFVKASNKPERQK